MTAVLQDVKLSPAQLGEICVGECTTLALRSILAFPSRQRAPQTPPSRRFPGVFSEGNGDGLHADKCNRLFRAIDSTTPPPPPPRPGTFCAAYKHILHIKYDRK